MDTSVKVFLAPPGDPEPDSGDASIAFINLAEAGIYFFLYPRLLRIRDETGQLIENCGHAHFEAAQVDAPCTISAPLARRPTLNLSPSSSTWVGELLRLIGRSMKPSHGQSLSI